MRNVFLQSVNFSVGLFGYSLQQRILCQKILVTNLFQACLPQELAADHEAMEVVKRHLRGTCRRP